MPEESRPTQKTPQSVRLDAQAWAKVLFIMLLWRRVLALNSRIMREFDANFLGARRLRRFSLTRQVKLVSR